MTWEGLLSLGGLAILLGRLRPWRPPPADALAGGAGCMVSIIVPCRNEENNVVPLIESLKALSNVTTEIIVVDDGSTDDTFSKAASTGVRVLKAPPKPEGWVGKSWACWQGACASSGKYLLFTDADTRHAPDSLHRGLSFLRSRRSDLVSAPPFHLCQNAFEKWLGLFHVLPMIAAPLNAPRNPRRLYAIGQYLLFGREGYFAVGGHEGIRASLTEDIDLAKRVLESGLRYSVYPRAGLYQVQMYRNFGDFCRGWSRLLRLGMKSVGWGAFLEIFLVFCPFMSLSLTTVAAVAALMWIQRQHGDFSMVGALVAPVSLAVFTVLSLVALVQTALGRKVVWRGRVYGQG